MAGGGGGVEGGGTVKESACGLGGGEAGEGREGVGGGDSNRSKEGNDEPSFKLAPRYVHNSHTDEGRREAGKIREGNDTEG